MHKPELCLFRHPTTTVFVDDSDDFLYSIALGVDRLPYRSFSAPTKGLDYVNQFARHYDVSDGERLSSSSIGAGKLFNRLGSKLHDHNRFAEPSVLVVDYSMPSMTGLDLCAQITNPNVKKVLLTGVADERLAIEALNIELIDFYISKRESNLAQRLRGIISHLETRYFQDLYAWSRDSEVRNVLPQLFDPAFADYFEDVVERLGIVEYYPIMEGPLIESTPMNNCGFRLINEYGNCKRLAVYSEAQLSELLCNADVSRLSSASREKLKQRELIPAQHTQPLAENQLLTPTVINGSVRWYCTLSNDGTLGEDSAPATSYQQFLKTPHAFEQAHVSS